MEDQIEVAVIGGGQAGLATSYELTRAGVEHVVLERGQIGETWRGRWDSFCLVTPNWTVQLPGHAYSGADPDGYMPRDEIVDYLTDYAAGFRAPVRERTEVTSLAIAPDGKFLLATQGGVVQADKVVVCTGAYQRPHRPPAAATLPPDLVQLDVDEYRNPGQLPPGKVLVIGSGQSGCQISEELYEAGREVFLSCGRAPWAPRRLGDRDIVWWAIETGFLDQPVSALANPVARLTANILTSGHQGGHDLHLRTLHRLGVTLLGHFLGAEGRRARFAPDLKDSLAWSDDRHRELMGLVRKLVAERSLPMPEIAEPAAFDGQSPEYVDLSGFGAVLFSSGFRPDYATWVPVPGAFDDLGFPVHDEGECVVAENLYFVGVHFLRTRKSSLLYGVREDAACVVRQIVSSR